MEVNWAGGIDNPGESDNHDSQVEHENEGDGDYRDNWWGSDLLCKIYRGGGQLILQVIYSGRH